MPFTKNDKGQVCIELGQGDMSFVTVTVNNGERHFSAFTISELGKQYKIGEMPPKEELPDPTKAPIVILNTADNPIPFLFLARAALYSAARSVISDNFKKPRTLFGREDDEFVMGSLHNILNQLKEFHTQKGESNV